MNSPLRALLMKSIGSLLGAGSASWRSDRREIDNGERRGGAALRMGYVSESMRQVGEVVLFVLPRLPSHLQKLCMKRSLPSKAGDEETRGRDPCHRSGLVLLRSCPSTLQRMSREVVLT